ncbi:glycoside hydrolase family 28 protein [Klebsiella michiganensis]|uniref:glycoside hydrolase family 28 protein n=6 Tax=Klebsiella/Raoultella group TaxID=2890311 RepID=UPI001CCDE507|nr:glycoside hydrolase family 28 protein [Klebsiella michiganensis]
MSFYLTGNPVPSASMPDVHDNAQNLDFALNEITSTFWTDRLGRRRMSWLGIESAFTMKLTDFESRFDFRLAEQESVFAESLVDKENRFQQFLGDSGYVFLGDYEDGPFQFSARNQYIRFQNQFYRLNKSTDTGFTTTGTDETSFANDVTHLVLMDGDTLRQNLGSSEEGQGAWLIAYLAGDSAVARTVAARLRDFVSLHDYWSPTDGTDYAPALNKALSVSPHVLIPPGKHYLKSTVSLISGTRLIGLGPNCILSSPDAVSASGAEMLTVLRTTGASDIVLRDLVIEGGCNAGVTSKRAIRGVRFINCTDIRMINCEVSRTGDWATSFEKCTDVSVVNYRHRKSGGTLYGGRDGIHFLDCVNFTLNGADIESGDDMVGCTTETRDQRNAVIRNVIGYSMLASGVIFNEEGATTFSTVDILVDGVTIKSGNVVRDVVRVQGINDATNVTGVTVQNVKGTGYSHGVFISGKKLTRVSVSDIDVVSTQSHGVYINGAQNMRASGMGVSQAAAFDGWNITNCSYFDASPRSLSSQGWGVQVLNCANFTLNGNCYNNGAGLFAAANGGNGRINGCSNYNATGVYVGGSTTSYYGLFNDETPTGRVDPATVCNGYIPRNRPRNLNALRDAYAACSFGQTVSGSISLQGVVNCSVELVSDGRYRINFTTPFESTFYRPEIVAQAMNQDLIVRPIAKDGSYYMFEVRNSSGVALANFILCEFKKAI